MLTWLPIALTNGALADLEFPAEILAEVLLQFGHMIGDGGATGETVVGRRTRRVGRGRQPSRRLARAAHFRLGSGTVYFCTDGRTQ